MPDLGLEQRIQRELTKLDHGLFLDKEFAHGSVYYTVKMLMEDGVAPLTVVDWRVGYQPLPLSSDLLDRVRYQEGDIREAITHAKVHNAVLKEKKRQEVLEDIENVVSDHQYHNHGFKVGDATPSKRRFGNGNRA